MKLKAAFVIFGLSLLITVSAHAQGLPCGGEDVDTTSCPLDTWVIVLVAASAAFAIFTLLKRRKVVTASLKSK